MMELPTALTNILNHLLNTHGSITSWNIYQGNSGTVNVNIRFPNITTESTASVDSHVQPVSYKQVSSRQLSRNKDRAEAYRAKQQQTDIDNKKRKLDVTSPECARTDELFTSDICQIDTPIKVADFKEEYQVADSKEEYQVADFQEEYTKHNDSFASCTSETDVNNAQAYESARRPVSDIPTQDSGDSVTVDYTEQKVTSINQSR